MSRSGLLVKLAIIIYIVLFIKSKGSISKRWSLGLITLYILQKIHEIGCWKYKLKNKSIPILFYKPGTGSLIFTMKHQNDDFHNKWVKEEFRLISKTKEPFTCYGYPAVNFQPNFSYTIYDAKLIKYIFEDNFEDYFKGPLVHDTFFELFGDGIFAADPPKWRFHRKVASRMFSMRNLKNYMFDCAVENTNILINKMDELSGRDNENQLDLFEIFGRFTLQSFIQSAFGEKLPIIESLPNPHEFCSSFDSLLSQCEQRWVDLFWKWKKYWKIGEREGKIIPHDVNILDNFINKIIAERDNKNIIDESGTDKHDLLSLFIKHGGIEKKDITKKDIRDITMNFVIAARDTTRILLSWFFYEITKPEYKEIMNNIYKEIDKYKDDKLFYADCAPYLGGRSKNDDNDNYKKQNVRKYQYLEAVLCEVLRLNPPVPYLQRYAKRDGIKVPYKTFDGKEKILYLDKGDGVCVYTVGYLRFPSIWGTKGRDPNKINVDNFYKNGVNSYDVYTFPVFNINPRLCLGKTSALLQAKIMMISILRKWRVIPIKEQIVRSALSPLLIMENGFKVRVEPRKQQMTP